MTTTLSLLSLEMKVTGICYFMLFHLSCVGIDLCETERIGALVVQFKGSELIRSSAPPIFRKRLQTDPCRQVQVLVETPSLVMGSFNIWIQISSSDQQKHTYTYT